MRSLLITLFSAAIAVTSFAQSAAPSPSASPAASPAIQQTLLTSALTLAGGLTLFIAGQIVLKLIDPCFEFKKYIAKIGADLLLYENYEHNITNSKNTAIEVFRSNAAELERYFNSILRYDYVSELVQLPTEERLRSACRKLWTLADFEAEITEVRTNKHEAEKELEQSDVHTRSLPNLPDKVRLRDQIDKLDQNCKDVNAKKLQCSNDIRSDLNIRRLFDRT